MRLRDSRRLRGPGLDAPCPGAIAEVEVEAQDRDLAEATWREAVREMTSALACVEMAEGAVVRRFSEGLAFFLPAPIDALYAATEINEFCIAEAAAVVARRSAEESFEAARRRLSRELDRERNERLTAIRAEARRRGISFVWDDDEVTVGLCAGARSYRIRRLPTIASIPWESLGAVPVAMVTGTNGKTTTTRLVARMVRLSGLTPGCSSSDGVAIDERFVERGDWTGAEAARRVLRAAEVEVAILETARGGILRRGLAIDAVDAACITNVAADHLGEYGVEDVRGMARVKAVVTRAVKPSGVVVLGVDDAELRALASELQQRKILFAEDPGCVAPHRASDGVAYVCEDEELVRYGPDGRTVLVPLTDVPLTFGGAARHNVLNALAACGVAEALGLKREAVIAALRTFGNEPSDNPGRGMTVTWDDGVRGLLDFGHNPDGLRALYGLARVLAGQLDDASIVAVLSQAGDRSDADLAALAAAVVEGGAVRVVLWESEGLRRGRPVGEVVARLRSALREKGLPETAISVAPGEAAAIEQARGLAARGDLVVVAPWTER